MLQWMDDFTSYGTDSSRVSRLVNGAYADNNACDLIADPDSSAGGQYVLSVGSNSSSVLRKVLSSPQTTVGVAARYWLSVLPSATSMRPWFAQLSDSGNIVHCFVTVNPSGYLEAYRRDTAGDTLLGQSSSPVIIANGWRHIETKFVLSDTSGSIQVKIEGTTVLNLTSIDTLTNSTGAATTASNVCIRNMRTGGTVGPSMYVKDFIIWDDSGSVNNTWMGACQVYKIVPDGDDSLGWSPSTGTTGWDLVNETTPTDDTGYISAASSATSPSTFTMTDLPANVTVVKGVMTIHRSRKVDGGDGQLQASVISSASSGDGEDRTITTAYTYWHDVHDLDPNGNINWTKAAVDALKMKLNRTV